MEEIQREIQKQFRQQQEKFVYYILALTVSSTGFAIYKTSGLTLKYSQIPLALSVLCWGLSIYFGIRFIKFTISNLFANNTYFDILAGRNPDLGNVKAEKNALAEGLKRVIESNGRIAEKYFNWQGRLFYYGIILFILWHVLEMYLLGRNSCQ